MAQWVKMYGAVDHILALGDNCYPRGCRKAPRPCFVDRLERIFLRHEALRVPWMAVLGNHDYMGDPDAQVDYCRQNPSGLWQLPERNYRFAYQLGCGTRVDLFALDSCGCQGHVRRAFPETAQQVTKNIEQLAMGLARTPHDGGAPGWKLVYAHHPLHTKGSQHSKLATCLREPGPMNYNLEGILSEHGAQAYFAGHEHVQQHHFGRAVQSFVIGAVSECGFYGGEGYDVSIDWHDRHPQAGFAYVRVNSERMTVEFIGAETKAVIETVTVPRQPAPRASPGGR
eukprot:TRINITY_DN9651_c0_g1_i1.p2 TRINITY_DN9651_c0_g1~~TRINITY_DN9651_c0_g1_i1.p2  ORF type:complete len:334 (+),score=63.02 TRINITY_DN9651_c0_g1_i1:152-1003(+)